MSMDPDRDHFEALRRLLAIKRHEQPPPGYFHTFSGNVILRIRTEQSTRRLSWWQRFTGETPWFDRIFGGLEVKPAFAGAMSFAVCGLIAAGLFYADAPAGINGGSAPGVFQAAVSPFEMIQPTAMAPTNGFLPPALRNDLFIEASGNARAPRAHNLKFTY